MFNVIDPRTTRLASIAMLTATALLSACGGGGGSGGGAAVSPSFPLGSTPSTVPEDLTSLTTLKEVQVNSAVAASVVVLSGTFSDLSTPAPRIGIRTQTGDIQEIAVQLSGLSVATTFVQGSSLDLENVSALPSGTLPFRWATGSRVAGTQQYLIDIVDPEAGRLQYHSFGTWGVDINTATPEAALGYFTVGTPSLASNIPTSSVTATYTGVLNAIYANSSSVTFHDVTASASATVNFNAGGGNGSIAFSTTNSVRQSAIGSATVLSAPQYNMNGTLLFAVGTNAISGTVTTVNGLSGTVTANFFGPPVGVGSTPPEIGGTFVLQSGGGAERMMGAFGVHQ